MTIINHFIQQPLLHEGLYQAQHALPQVIHSSLFPCYRSEYIQSQPGYKGVALKCYSKTYNVIAAIGHGLSAASHQAVFLIQIIASGILHVGDPLLGWAVRPISRGISKIYNVLFPLNPITNQRRFIPISRGAEKTLGNWVFYPNMTQGFCATSGFLKNTQEQIADRVDRVVQQLLQANQPLMNPENETAFAYHTTTVIAGQLNAFAIPGGEMIVFSKIVKELHAAIESGKIKEASVSLPDGSRVTIDLRDVKLDDALAALMGHEMTHIASRHGLTTLFPRLFMFYATRFIEWVVLIFLKLKKEEYFSENGHHILTLLERLIYFLDPYILRIISYQSSRRNEYEADVAGTYFAHQASFNPLGALYLQEFLLKASGQSWLHQHFEFCYTHPYGEHRKQGILSAIHTFARDQLQGVISVEHRAESKYDSQRDPAIHYSEELLRMN